MRRIKVPHQNFWCPVLRETCKQDVAMHGPPGSTSLEPNMGAPNARAHELAWNCAGQPQLRVSQKMPSSQDRSEHNWIRLTSRGGKAHHWHNGQHCGCACQAAGIRHRHCERLQVIGPVGVQYALHARQAINRVCCSLHASLLSTHVAADACRGAPQTRRA